MNFMLFKNQRSHSGAVPWNRLLFEQLIYRKLKVSASLPDSNQIPFTVNSEIKILPVEITIPAFDHKIEQLQGPFYDFSDENLVKGFYNVVEQPLDALKYKVKEQLAKVRYEWEIEGIVLTLNGLTLQVPTNREERHLFLQALQLTVDPVEWKFNNVWTVLTPDDLKTIVMAIVTHVQGCFNWENQLTKTIDGCTSILELKAVSLVPPSTKTSFKPRMIHSQFSNPLN